MLIEARCTRKGRSREGTAFAVLRTKVGAVRVVRIWRRRRPCCMQCSVPGDEVGFFLLLPVDWAGGVVGRGLGGAEAYKALDWFFAEDVFAIELGHRRV